MNQTPLVNIPIDNLVPHSEPMILIDRLLDATTQYAVAQVTITEQSQFFQDGEVPAWVGIEYMAQSIAAHAGYQALLAGRQPDIGFLLGSRKYEAFTPAFNLGDKLTVKVELLYVENALAAFSCQILLAEDCIAKAKITTYLPEGDVATAYLRGQNK